MGVQYRVRSSDSASHTGGAEAAHSSRGVSHMDDATDENHPCDDSPMEYIGGAGEENPPWDASHMGGVGASHMGGAGAERGVGEGLGASHNGGHGAGPRRKRARRTRSADATNSPLKRYIAENKKLLEEKCKKKNKTMLKVGCASLGHRATGHPSPAKTSQSGCLITSTRSAPA